MSDVIQLIDQAIDATAGIVKGIGDHQWDAPTPCAGWHVRAVLNHTVGGMRIFTAELTGAGADHEADWLGDDPRAAFAAAGDADREAWHRDGALDHTVHISLGALPGPMAAVIHFTEVLVHGVDLAVATGQEDRVDEPLCEELLATMRGMGGIDAYRLPGVFGPEAEAPAGAPAHRRLLAYLGRTV
ncbi:TIGR03086 family metal-binding protein [Microbispora sp. NBC_01189]|uniref:TIGR03086 family metal-binding protein n=1 Tax=Microbispora sp. NBC_01189 TaxID=2903583 RepID=UPI002E0DA900|nr:TIGR03086 family metal-binding protein [Microbispora sp. NBC_01189]